MSKPKQFMLQYGHVNVQTVVGTGADILITEGAPLGGTPAISDGQVSALESGGVGVLGYVDSSVTDDSRPYWRASWTDDGTDTGTPTASAPDWLKNQPSNAFGYVVDFTDKSWQKIVIDQAKDLITRGYSGIFLDDVAQYFVSGATGLSIAGQATAMETFVVKIADAIRAINPDAVLYVNATPYIVSDATGGADSAASKDFLDTVTGMMVESYFGFNGAKESAAIKLAEHLILPHMNVLALEYGGALRQTAEFYSQAEALGFSSFMSLTSAYDTEGYTHIEGSGRPDMLSGTGGSDIAFGRDGKDVIRGGSGADYLDGGAGNDRLSGGNGADIYVGGRGDDILSDSAGKGDLFLFSGKAFGDDRIEGFDPGHGHIEFDHGAKSMADLSLSRSGHDVIVQVDGDPHASITLVGAHLHAIDSSDFIFS
jgi:uncharacterized protein (TIGR01370 family)